MRMWEVRRMQGHCACKVHEQWTTVKQERLERLLQQPPVDLQVGRRRSQVLSQTMFLHLQACSVWLSAPACCSPVGLDDGSADAIVVSPLSC